MGPCSSFSCAVGNQGHRSVSQGREGGRRQGSSDKGTKANHLVSERPAGLPLSIVCCWEDAGPGLEPGEGVGGAGVGGWGWLMMVSGINPQKMLPAGGLVAVPFFFSTQ